MRWPSIKRKTPYLGVDIGSTAVKAAAYQDHQWLVAKVPTPSSRTVDNETIAAAVAEAASRTGWRGRRAVMAVSGDKVIVRYLRLPPMPSEDLKRGMAYEIKNHLPTGTHDMVVDWTVIDDGTAGEGILVLLAAAPRDQVMNLHQLCQAAGLELVAVDLIPLALCRSLAGVIKGSAVVVDIGGRWSNLVLVKDGKPLFSRVIPQGTEELSRPGYGGSSRLAELTQEIRRTLEFYRSQSGVSFSPENLFLTGGGALMEGIQEFCKDELDVAVSLPAVGSNGPGDPSLAVAVGLALREKIK